MSFYTYLGNEVFIFIFLLEISVPPMMWVPAQQISAIRGAPRAKLTCFVEAHPEALTYWEKDRKMIQQSKRHKMVTHKGTPSYKVNSKLYALSLKAQKKPLWLT